MSTDPPRSFRPAEQVSTDEVDGELVLLNLADGNFHVARGLGPRIWELFTQGRSIDEIVERVAQRYGEDPGKIRADVEGFASVLIDKGLLVVDLETP